MSDKPVTATEGQLPAKEVRKKEKPHNAHSKRFQKPDADRPEGEWAYRVDKTKMRKVDNDRFTQYYRDVHPICGKDATEADWEQFLETMRTPLGTTIWINDTDPMAEQVSAHLKSLGDAVASPIPWYPIEGMGWRINIDKIEFRRNPDHKAFRRFLVTQTASGTVSRQEEVSMIPTFLLDIQPNDVCFDMCASPGSKTAQMLTALCRGKMAKGEAPGVKTQAFDYNSGGCVIANELDFLRANMLIYQVKRLRSLFPFALFTNHDARFFPQPKMANGEELEFDKVLCDVVCSGDGTLRKAPQLLGQWRHSLGLNLQPLQVQIGLRGCHSLKVGGRMVYSTCSLNPIEDEAIVTQLVARTKGAMRLVDARKDLLPNLDCDPGFTTWTVMDTKGNVCTDPATSGLNVGCFPIDPPPYGLDLTKCMRFMPKHCNGGGFFVAVLEKVAPFKLNAKEVEDEEKAEEEKEKEKRKQAECRAAGKKGERDEEKLAAALKAIDEQPIVSKAPRYYPAPPTFNESAQKFWGVDTLDSHQLVVRCDRPEDEAKTKSNVPNSSLYFTSRLVHEILMARDRRCTIVSAGVRAFHMEKLIPEWRATGEASTIFAPRLQGSSRIVHLTYDDVVPMVTGGPLKDVLIADITNEALKAEVEALERGPLMFIIAGKYRQVACPGYRARSRIQLFIDKEDIVGLKTRIGMTVSEEEASQEATSGKTQEPKIADE